MTDLWRAILPQGPSTAEAEALVKRCSLPAGAKVLDVPCGEGRIAVELAAMGLNVTGIDISSDLIGDAKAKATARGLHVDFQLGDMRDLPAGANFDAIFCMGDSFGYMDDTGNLAFLKAARAAVRPGGWLVIEIKMLAEILFPNFRDKAAADIGGMKLNISRSFDPREGRLEVEYRLSKDGHEESRHASYRIYTSSQIADMLESAGFTSIALEDVAGREFRLGSDKLIVTARIPR